MKKVLSLLLALVMCLSLCACSKEVSVRASNCEKQIDQLGTITLDSKSAIESARNFYDSLSEDEKAQISNYDKLTSAETTYERLVNEFNTKLENLLAAEPSKETLNALRQLPNCDAVNEAISTVSMEIIKQYLASGNGDNASTASLTYEVDGKYVIISKSKSTARSALKSSYKLSRSEENIRFYAGGALYSRTDFCEYNRYDVCFASWYTYLSEASSKEKVSGLGMKVSGPSGTLISEWPYAASEDTLNEMYANITDADEFLLEVDADLRKKGMPFSAWELAGIYDPDMR